jgi:hypothetical protein
LNDSPYSTSKEACAYDRSQILALLAPGEDTQPNPKRRTLVILDARLRNYIALLNSGWSARDVLVVEILPLTALYQDVLGATVVMGRIGNILQDPPREPRWLWVAIWLLSGCFLVALCVELLNIRGHIQLYMI